MHHGFKLKKSILSYRDGTLTKNYINGKEISAIRNKNSTITQPFPYENGRGVRMTQGDRSYTTYDFDPKGRNTGYTKYDATGKKGDYGEYTYQDGLPFGNAAPENYFKGFPDEIKDIQPNRLQRTSIYYAMHPVKIRRVYIYTYLMPRALLLLPPPIFLY